MTWASFRALFSRALWQRLDRARCHVALKPTNSRAAVQTGLRGKRTNIRRSTVGTRCSKFCPWPAGIRSKHRCCQSLLPPNWISEKFQNFYFSIFNLRFYYCRKNLCSMRFWNGKKKFKVSCFIPRPKHVLSKDL